MTRHIHFRLAVMTVFCVMALAVEAAAAPTLINACGTINKPGSYVLSKNLTAPGDCLVVAADFITIDLNGFVVSGRGTASGVTVKAGNRYRGTVVRNGTITNFAIGINLLRGGRQGFSGDAAVIERMRVEHPQAAIHGQQRVLRLL